MSELNVDKINFQKPNLQAVSQIGKGAFGVVCLVNDSNEEEQLFALKIIHLPKIAQQFPRFSLKRIRNEANRLCKLQHKNIVPYIDDWLGGPNSKLYEENPETKIYLGKQESSSAPFTDSPLDYFFIQMKYFPKCLEKFLLSHDSQNKRSTIRPKMYDIFQQSLEGLEYVHSKGILHRDLKPANILISETPVLHVVVGDFGLAIDEDSTMSVAGTWDYRAPELEYTQTHTESTDIFSLGLTFRECLEYFPDALSRHSVFETYKDQSGNLEDVLQRTYCSQALDELEWQLVYKMTNPFRNSIKNATCTLEWIRKCLLCDNPTDIIWNECTRGMLRVPSPLWINVPLPVKTFVGRQNQINELVNLWKNPNQVVHISGLSGMGISQLLYKFLDCIRGFSHCIFFNARTIESFQQSLLLVFSSLGLGMPSPTVQCPLDTIEQMRILTEELNLYLPSLIIVLNKYSNSQAELVELVNFLCNFSVRMVIVTSNNNDSIDRHRPSKLDVTPLSQEESVELMCRVVDNLPTSDLYIKELVSLLGCVPCVLNSTAEYLQTFPDSDLLKSILELYRKLKGSEESVFKDIVKQLIFWSDSINQALEQWITKSTLKRKPHVAKQFAGSFLLVLAFIHPSTVYYSHFPNYLIHMVDLDYEVMSTNVSQLVKCLVNHNICFYTEDMLSINAAVQRCIRLGLNDSLSHYMNIVVKVLDERVIMDETFVNAALFWERFVFPNKNLTKQYMEWGIRLAKDLLTVKSYSQMEKHTKCKFNYFIEYPPESEIEAIYSTRSKVLYAIALIVCYKEDWEVMKAIEGLTLKSIEAAFCGFVNSEMLHHYISIVQNKIPSGNIEEPVSTTEEGPIEDLDSISIHDP